MIHERGFKILHTILEWWQYYSRFILIKYIINIADEESFYINIMRIVNRKCQYMHNSKLYYKLKFITNEFFKDN